MDDASAVLSYLGDADVLLHSFRGAVARNYEAEGVVQSAAASIAVRGVLFGNSHPLPPRYPFIHTKHAIYVWLFFFSFCFLFK